MKKIVIILASFFLAGLSQSLHSDIKAKHNPQETLKHKVTVTLKLVQVYVTDKEGHPVMNLEKEDFELYDNGERKTITEFEKYILMPHSPIEVSAHESKKKPLAAQKMTRKFFIFFDFAFNNPPGIKKSKEAALHFLETGLRSDDEVGIITYSLRKGLTLHEYLTTDHKRVHDMIKYLDTKEVVGRARDMEELLWKDASAKSESLNGGFQKQTGPPKFKFKQEFTEYSYHALNFSLRMRELGKALRYIPGNKHIVLLSSGIASSLLYGIGSTKIGKLGDTRLRKRYEDMLRELTASNTVVYPINSEELRTFIYKHEDMTGVFTLQRMARETGGKYFDHVHDYKNITEEIKNITGSFYVLGYYISENWDGSYRKIEVRVKKNGYKVHAQRGYFNPKPFSEYSELEKRLQLMDLALSKTPHFQSTIEFPLITFPCFYHGEHKLVVIARIPREDIASVASEKMEIIDLVFKENKIAGFKKGVFNFLALPSKESIYYYSLFSLSPGEYEIRVMIRNLETGEAARGAASMALPERADPSLWLDPPLLLKYESSAIYLKGRARIEKGAKAEHISFTELYPFDYSFFTPVVKKLARGTDEVLAILRGSEQALESPLSIKLTSLSSREEIPLSYTVLESYLEKGTKTLVITVMLPLELHPGEYEFCVSGSKNRNGYDVAEGKVNFTIE